MQRQWYPTALTLVVLGCAGTVSNPEQAQGGSAVDGGAPTVTGGTPSVRYGILVTGGAGSMAGSAAVGGRNTGGIDTGVPKQTGGTPTDLYGILPTGGRGGLGGGVVAYYGPLVQGGNS